MAVTLDIKNMSFEDKIMTMEALWEDLVSSAKSKEPPMPIWHETLLQDRQAQMERGEMGWVSLDELKADLK